MTEAILILALWFAPQVVFRKMVTVVAGTLDLDLPCLSSID